MQPSKWQRWDRQRQAGFYRTLTLRSRDGPHKFTLYLTWLGQEREAERREGRGRLARYPLCSTCPITGRGCVSPASTGGTQRRVQRDVGAPDGARGTDTHSLEVAVGKWGEMMEEVRNGQQEQRKEILDCIQRGLTATPPQGRDSRIPITATGREGKVSPCTSDTVTSARQRCP